MPGYAITSIINPRYCRFSCIKFSLFPQRFHFILPNPPLSPARLPLSRRPTAMFVYREWECAFTANNACQNKDRRLIVKAVFRW
jgi:hypothetical protein